MATNLYRYEICKYEGPEAEFRTPNGHRCPNPVVHKFGDNREDVFPLRVFKCDPCGAEGEQHFFFERYEAADPDPLEEGWQAICGGDEEARVERIDDEFSTTFRSARKVGETIGCGREVTVTQIK